MEQWDARKKTMTRYTVDRVAEMTNSLVLQGEDGSRLTLRVALVDSSWSLYRSRTLAVAEGDRARALGRELKGTIQAKAGDAERGKSPEWRRRRAGTFVSLSETAASARDVHIQAGVAVQPER